MVVDLLTLRADHNVHGPGNLCRHAPGNVRWRIQQRTDRHQSTNCSVHLVAQREDFQVIHRLFFPGSVDGFQKHRQPGKQRCLIKLILTEIRNCVTANVHSTCCCPPGSAVRPPPAAARSETTAAASSPSPAPCQRWPCKNHTWCLQLPAGSSSSSPEGIPAAYRHATELRSFPFPHCGNRKCITEGLCLLVVFCQSLHQVPTALNVSPLNVRVEAGTQCELKRLAGDRLGRAVHAEIPSGKTLLEVALLQVQPEEEEGRQNALRLGNKKISLVSTQSSEEWKTENLTPQFVCHVGS